MMYLLDTDHMSLLDRGGTEGRRVRDRLRILLLEDVATTIVSYEEQMRGWLGRVARATTLERRVSDYGELRQLLRNYCDIAIVDFDARAATEFERLRQARIRIGTMDLKIAAIALANDATLLIRNLSDFGKVPELKVEDWSV
jgi:tRNA(fMet)-specific endonuclease VapC